MQLGWLQDWQLSPNGSVSIDLQSPNKSPRIGPKYVALDYTNNDVAIATSWINGMNTRNFIELPLAGRSSELFSVDKGWDDSGTLGILIDGLDGESAVNGIVIGNVNGEDGVQPMGAEFVGMRSL